MQTASSASQVFNRVTRWAVIALSSLLVLSACTATATVESVNAPAAPDTAAPAATADPEFAPNEGAPNAVQEGDSNGGDAAQDNDSDDADDNTSDQDVENDTVSEGDSATADGSALFDPQGSIPMDTEQVNSLILFVEEQTGRPFLRPPVIVAQTSDEFFEGLAEASDDGDDDPEGDDAAVRTMQALGLTTKGVGEVTAAVEALTSEPGLVLGYYDPDADQLFLPGESQDDSEFQAVLVHELTHALDGQYADLTVLEPMLELAEESGDYELVSALRAVIEGRASVVESQWRIENNAPEVAPDDLGAAADVPPTILLALGIPYIFGEQYIQFNGGAAGTWDEIENPPASSEEFIAIGTPRDETIVNVPAPAADGPVIEELVFGATDILAWLLGESLDPDPNLIFPAITAVDGWAGGRSVLWGDDTESCVRIALAGDTPTDLLEIEEVMQLWVADGPDRTVETDGDLVVVTGCAPYVP